MTEKRKRAAKPKYEVICEYREWLESQGFKFEWLDKLNADYGFDKFEYIPKFKAFRCYKEEQHLDWADVNDIAMLNGHRRLIEILLKHQRVSPKRAVIQYIWS